MRILSELYLVKNLKPIAQIYDEKFGHIQLGDAVTIVKPGKHRKIVRFCGKIIYKNNHFFTLQNENKRRFTVMTFDLIRKACKMEVVK